MAKPAMHAFIVNTGSLPTLSANRIEAAYYQTENGFTTFKDVDNQAVFTVRDDHLVSVERADDSTPIADLRQLMAEADSTDSVVHGHFVSRDTDPDGRVHETVYEVQVKAVTGSVSDLPDTHVDVHVTAPGSAETMRAAARRSLTHSGSLRA